MTDNILHIYICTGEEETLWRMFNESVDTVRLRCLRVYISDMEIAKQTVFEYINIVTLINITLFHDVFVN